MFIKITAINKKNPLKSTQRHTFKTTEEVLEFIKKIKPGDMAIKTYCVEYSPQALHLLQKYYKPEFFDVHQHEELIVLKPLKNGVRRSLVYTKITNSNATLERTLKRINDELTKELEAIDFSFEMPKIHMSSERDQIIFITLEDLRNTEQRDKGLCVISFDKKTWSYNFLSIETSRLEEAFNVIKKTFDKRTTSTRVYRGKKNEDTPQ